MREGIVVTELQWFDDLAEQYSISVLRTVDISCQISLYFYHIDFDDEYTVEEVCDDFNKESESVMQAWPVIIPEWYEIPNDDYYDYQWGLAQIDAPLAWDYETGDASVLIGILDTGADVYDSLNQEATIHPDLENNLWNENDLYGLNVIDPGNRPEDGFGHGTHVSGIVGAITNNSTGVSGVAGGGFENGNGVKLLIVRNGDNKGSSSEEIMAESICQALNPDSNWSTNDWVDVINMSWGLKRTLGDLPPSCEGAFPILRLVIEEAYNKGVILVAAAGNDGRYIEQCYLWPYPAGYDEVIAVAATGPEDDHVSYSTRGPFIEVAAPGGDGWELTNVPGGHGIEYDSDDIYSTYPRDPFTLQDPDYWDMILIPVIVETNITNNYGYCSGTSMAAPHVSGLAGLILSRFPSYNVEDVRNLIKSSAEKAGLNSYNDNGWNMYLGYGRINAGYAIAPPSTPTNFYGTGSQGQNPTLHWDDVEESDTDHLELHRTVTGQSGGDCVVNISPDSTQYTDNTIIIDKFGPASITYILRSVDITDQNSGFTGPVTYDGEGLWKQLAMSQRPVEYSLRNNIPNPFNPVTTIQFGLPENSKIDLVVYDLTGRVVKTLVSGRSEAGYQRVAWDGSNARGVKVSSGVYIYRLRAVSLESEKLYTKSGKMVLLR